MLEVLWRFSSLDHEDALPAHSALIDRLISNSASIQRKTSMAIGEGEIWRLATILHGVTNAEPRRVTWRDNTAAFVAAADWLARSIGHLFCKGGADANGCIVVTYTPSGRGGTHSWGLNNKANVGQDESCCIELVRNRAAYQVANVRRSLGFPPYHELNIPYGAIESIVRSTGAEPWFIWAIQNRRIRGETNSAMDWIVKHIPKDKLIFEVGCGCGANLIWLAQRGYHNLVGTDRSSSAIFAATQLADLAQRTISVHVADGFAHPKS